MTSDDAGTGTDASATSETGAPPTSACASGADDAEAAGLYIVGGVLADSTTEPTDIIRIPIHCDGSLGVAVTLPTTIPRSFIWGGAATLDDHVVLFGGSHDTGGPPLAKQAYVASRQPDGTLGAFLPTPAIDGLDRWRFAVATTTARAYLLGGLVSSSTTLPDHGPDESVDMRPYDTGADAEPGVVYDVFTARIDRLSFNGSTLEGHRLAKPLYDTGARFAAAIVGNRVVTYGLATDTRVVDAKVRYAELDADGELASEWSTIGDYIAGQFDGMAVADGNFAYLLGGSNRNDAFAYVDLTPNQTPTLTVSSMVGATGAPSNHPHGVAASLRGWVYILDDQATVLHYARLEAGILKIIDGPAIPVGRTTPSMFVF